MIEIIFLSVLAVIWILFASFQDLKSRIVSNWLNFSLIIFALGFRFFYSLFSEQGFNFFYQGLIGLGIFFVLGNFFYYGRMFAGGDAKLMIALGPILGFSTIFLINLKIFILFFILFLFSGAFYGLSWSVFLSLRNFKGYTKEFYKQLNENKKYVLFIMFFGIFLLFFGFIEKYFFYLGILIFLLPYFYIYAKAVDESCLIKRVKTKNLVEGDWLYKDLKLKSKVIKAKWEGLNNKEIEKIKKEYKEIKIRQGIPFTPVFLISFLFLVYVYFFDFGLIESLF